MAEYGKRVYKEQVPNDCFRCPNLVYAVYKYRCDVFRELKPDCQVLRMIDSRQDNLLVPQQTSRPS